MKFRLIYPKWPKLARQTEFHLPPHGPVVFAATLPDYVEVDFIDENLETIDFDDPVDFVGISMMLTVQVQAGLGDRRHLPGKRDQGHLRRHRHHAPCRGNHGPCRCGLPWRGRGADGTGLCRFPAGQPPALLQFSRRAARYRPGGHGPPRYPQPEALQPQGRADGRSGPCLARLPLQLLSLRGGLSRRAGIPAAAH